jgi:hypothetical protein
VFDVISIAQTVSPPSDDWFMKEALRIQAGGAPPAPPSSGVRPGGVVFAKRTTTTGSIKLAALVDGKVVKVVDDKNTEVAKITLPSGYKVEEATFSNGIPNVGPFNTNEYILFLKLSGVTPLPTYMVIEACC